MLGKIKVLSNIKNKVVEIRTLLIEYGIVGEEKQDEFMNKLFKIIGVIK